jgi:hypothetical protein
MLGIKLDDAELREIERAARTLNTPKSQYIRLLLSGGSLQKLQPREDSSLVAKNDETALAEIRTELAQMRTEHAEIRGMR